MGKYILNNTYRYLEGKSKPVSLFFVIFIIDFTIQIIISIVINIYNPQALEIFEEGTSLTEIFILSLIFSPLIETFIVQYLIIETLLYFKKIKTNLIIVISAFSFSLLHNYNLTYILLTVIPGLIYASYYIYLKLETKKNPFLQIWALHALYNFIVFLLNDVFNL